MRLTVEREIRDGYVWLRVRGRWELEEVFQIIDRIRKESEKADLDRAFVDMRGVDGPIPNLDRFFAGERVAVVLGSHVRLAVLARPESINKFGENTAVNRGARILVSSSEEEAAAFLA